jgi:hypothetical protein
MMPVIVALAATADAALVPLFCITRETDSNLASKDVKGPPAILPKIFFPAEPYARFAGKYRFMPPKKL